ncbi:MAG: CBS domain-containing protein [Proteobacteria bacterium]|nr:MAG: CBS domain-containing protein [Pseudomonadota bacterium]QKK11408.1 MAG: CBS domain-containing protein [Pseudomonadota bacterium]
MSEDRPSGITQRPSWLGRLSQAILGEPKDQNELVDLLRDAQSRDLLDHNALAMMEGVMQVSEMRVRDIMIPRSQMVVVERDAPLDTILPIIIESAHSRFPVIGESRDEVAGILLAKDLLNYCFEDVHQEFHLRDLLRPAVFIPESKRLDVLLRDFRSSRNHLAVVVDEYGGVAGLVTIEDVLEQIVGEIEDEHDTEEDAFILTHKDGKYAVKALTPIEDFNEFFHCDFEDEEFDTVGGLVLQHFGRVPRRGESVTLGRFRFKVVRADSRRLHLLHLHILSDEELAQETSQ